MGGVRPARVAEVVREVVGSALLHELNDPRIGFVTVMEVDVTADLARATVRVSVMGDDAAKRTTMRGLESAARFIRRKVGERLTSRRVPEIVFKLDSSIDRTIRLSELVRETSAPDEDDEGTDSETPEADEDDSGKTVSGRGKEASSDGE